VDAVINGDHRPGAALCRITLRHLFQFFLYFYDLHCSAYLKGLHLHGQPNCTYRPDLQEQDHSLGFKTSRFQTTSAGA